MRKCGERFCKTCDKDVETQFVEMADAYSDRGVTVEICAGCGYEFDEPSEPFNVDGDE